MRRVMILVVIGAVMALAIPAYAKGAYQATISGNGWEVTFTGEGEPHTNTVLSNLAGSVMLFDRVWSLGKARGEAPTGDLGPRITILWSFIGPDGDIPVEQHIYPFAEGGPVGHFPPGQLFIDQPVLASWFPIQDDVLETLGAAGFYLTSLDQQVIVANEPVPPAPRLDPVPVVEVEAPKVAVADPLPTKSPTRAVTIDPTPPEQGSSAWWMVGAAALLAAGTLAAGSGMIRRRNERTA